jgi:hypothetical protein
MLYKYLTKCIFYREDSGGSYGTSILGNIKHADFGLPR